MQIKRLLFPVFSLSCPFLIAGALHLHLLPIEARYYPVIMNGAFACAFGFSLLGKKALVTRIAEGMGEELDEAGIRYTRKVTFAWMCFNICNGAVAFATVFAPLWVWTIYNGVIAYILMGLMFLIESICRRKARNARKTI